MYSCRCLTSHTLVYDWLKFSQSSSTVWLMFTVNCWCCSLTLFNHFPFKSNNSLGFSYDKLILWCAFAASQTVCKRGKMKLCLSVALWALCAGFAPMLSSWLCGVLRGVDGVFFFPFFSPCCFSFVLPPFLFLPSCTPTCIPHARVLVLLVPPPPHLPASLLCNPSSLPPRSRLFPHPLPPRPLTDPLPPSLAGTPCRTVWRRSIRQSNPESLPSGR